MSCIDDVFRSAINPPTSGNTFAAYVAAAKALGSNEPAVGCYLQAFHVLTHSLDGFQISDSGPVTGGVGAVATATPAPTSANSSSATASKSSSTSSSGSYSSAGHLVTNGLFSLLAVAFGITLA